MPTPAPLSVMMPVYNAEKYLPAALASVLGQTYGDFELIAIDDGSTDGSLAILRDSVRKDPRVRVISRPNTGIAGARNDALARAAGTYVACADADDISLPDRFRKQMAFLAEHPEIAVLGGSLREIDADGELLPTIHRYPTEPSEIELALPLRCCFGQPAVVLNRQAALEAGGYRAAFAAAEDYDLWLRLTERHSLANLPDLLVYYRVHPMSATNTAYLHQALATRVAQKCAEQRRRSGGDPLESRSQFSPEVLTKLGISPLEVEFTHARAYRARVSRMIERGQTDAAAELLKTYNSSEFSKRVRRKLAGEFEFLDARRAFRNGRGLTAAALTMKACTMHPAFALELARKLLRRHAR